MKIAHTELSLYSQHASASLRAERTSLRAWRGDQRPDFEGQGRMGPRLAGVAATVSDAARAAAAAHDLEAPARVDDGGSQHDPRLRMLIDLVERLTGRAVQVFDARALQPQEVPDVLPPAGQAAAGAAGAAPARAGWGLEIDTHTLVAEAEVMQFAAQGVVRTADGLEIEFSVQLEMSRAFVQETQVSIREGDAVLTDPLVINFSGRGAELTSTRFAFDLNADGKTEDIAFVTGGSGLLVLDKNRDGRVNDGSELFGPASGDGFADLARHDQDGNQWIDENDAVYSKLQVWQRDAQGQDRLTSLKQAGVGALYLGRVASPFSINETASNQTLGLVRSTGVFLYESGQAGTLQQVDL